MSKGHWFVLLALLTGCGSSESSGGEPVDTGSEDSAGEAAPLDAAVEKDSSSSEPVDARVESDTSPGDAKASCRQPMADDPTIKTLASKINKAARPSKACTAAEIAKAEAAMKPSSGYVAPKDAVAAYKANVSAECFACITLGTVDATGTVTSENENLFPTKAASGATPEGPIHNAGACYGLSTGKDECRQRSAAILACATIACPETTCTSDTELVNCRLGVYSDCKAAATRLFPGCPAADYSKAFDACSSTSASATDAQDFTVEVTVVCGGK